MKCIYCGSTAQVKLISEDENIKVYQCGCGTLIVVKKKEN